MRMRSVSPTRGLPFAMVGFGAAGAIIEMSGVECILLKYLASPSAILLAQCTRESDLRRKRPPFYCKLSTEFEWRFLSNPTSLLNFKEGDATSGETNNYAKRGMQFAHLPECAAKSWRLLTGGE